MEKITCVICYESINHEKHNFFECSHNEICESCVIKLKKCPICRNEKRNMKKFNLLKTKKYYQKNKEEILKRKNISLYCIYCQCYYTKNNQQQHFKTNKHKFLAALNN